MKIYLASSWRNEHYPATLAALQHAGHEVYDFRAAPGAFHWRQIDPDWTFWNARSFVQGLQHPLAQQGFDRDINALQRADVCVLCLPCNRSAHLELGIAIGLWKPTIIYIPDRSAFTPELMYGAASHIVDTMQDLLAVLATYGTGNALYIPDRPVLDLSDLRDVKPMEPPC